MESEKNSDRLLVDGIIGQFQPVPSIEQFEVLEREVRRLVKAMCQIKSQDYEKRWGHKQGELCEVILKQIAGDRFDALEKRIKAVERNSHSPMPKDTAERLEALEGQIERLASLMPTRQGGKILWPVFPPSGRTLGHAK